MFVYIEVQSYAIRVQLEETWCCSINRMKWGLSQICVLCLFIYPYIFCAVCLFVCLFVFDDGEKTDINDFSTRSTLGFHTVQRLVVPRGLCLGFWVSAFPLGWFPWQVVGLLLGVGYVHLSLSVLSGCLRKESVRCFVSFDWLQEIVGYFH